MHWRTITRRSFFSCLISCFDFEEDEEDTELLLDELLLRELEDIEEDDLEEDDLCHLL